MNFQSEIYFIECGSSISQKAELKKIGIVMQPALNALTLGVIGIGDTEVVIMGLRQAVSRELNATISAEGHGRCGNGP